MRPGTYCILRSGARPDLAAPNSPVLAPRSRHLQISRNAFRGTPRAYATDGLARRLAEARLRPRFDELPVAARMSVVLVYIHSEDKADVAVVEDMLARLRPALEPVRTRPPQACALFADTHA